MDDVKDVAREVLTSVVPVIVLVIILQLILFENPGPKILQFAIGAVMVTLGLGLFLIGVKVGLLPLGEAIGAELPQKGSFPLLLLSMLFIGIAITAAEPDIRILTHQIDQVSGGGIPKNLLISFVAIGVGLFITIGTARVVLGIPMSYILIGSYGLIFLLAALAPPILYR